MKTFIIFILIFSLIVGIHEFGHFFLAKRSGIQVREFAIGMGPKIFSTQDRDGTTYTLRILPLGGYVRLAGLIEDDELEPGMSVTLLIENDQVTRINLSEQMNIDELPVSIHNSDLIHEMTIDAIPMNENEIKTFSVSKEAMIIDQEGIAIKVSPYERRYEAASWWAKLKTNIAGPMSNFILSVIIFTIVAFLLPGVPTNSPLPVIGQIVEESAAQNAGLKADDIVTRINDQSINSWENLVEYVSERPGETVDLEVNRNGEEINLKLSIESYHDETIQKEVGKMGVIKGDIYDSSIMARFSYGFKQTWMVMTGILYFFKDLFTKGLNIDQLGGPVAMVEMTSQVSQFGLVAVLQFVAFISVNLGTVNLLPIPALDGGKIVLNIIEGVRGKPLSQSKEGIISLIGALFLILLMLFVTWNDIARVFFK